MTNEEKAREIDEMCNNSYDAAMKMAEWKDEKMKSYVDEFNEHTRKIVEGLKNCYNCLYKEHCKNEEYAYYEEGGLIRTIRGRLMKKGPCEHWRMKEVKSEDEDA